ncbi:sensor histidine kinase [Streptomyces sp. NPDC054784]
MEATATAARTLARRLLPGPWTRTRLLKEAAVGVQLAGSCVLIQLNTDHGLLSTVLSTLAVLVLGLLRMAFPATVLVIAGALNGGIVDGAMPLLVAASWSAGWRIERPRNALAAFAATFAVQTALTVHTNPWVFSLARDAAFVSVYFVGVAVVPALIGRYRAQRRMLLLTLHKHNSQLLRERELIAGQARLRERHRIAQDMHDSLGHQLALIAVHTGALQVDPTLSDRQREAVGVLRDASGLAMHELRDVVGLLRDDTQDVRADRAELHGVAHVDAVVEASRAAGATVELRRFGRARPVGTAGDQVAYRVVQEGLTNIHKHAPGAPVTVTLRYEPDSLLVEVANGPADDAARAAAGRTVSGGAGLRGLEERAGRVGGMLHHGPASGGGFRLAAVLPYGAEDDAHGGAYGAEGERGYGGTGGGAYGGTDGGAGTPADATFVGAEGDFRRQTGAGALGDGGPVIDRSQLSEEYNAVMSTRKNTAIGCATVFVVVVVGGLALLGWGAMKLFDEVDKATISEDTYRGTELGSSLDDVESRLPEGSDLMTGEYKSEGPAIPKGATCRHFMSSKTKENLEKELVYRFCFREGKLVEKQSFEVEL